MDDCDPDDGCDDRDCEETRDGCSGDEGGGGDGGGDGSGSDGHGSGGSPDPRLQSLLDTAYSAALQELQNPECANFAAKDGSGFLKDPTNGQDLSPSRILTNLVKGDQGYGSINFADLGSGGLVATTSGVGLQLGLSGPHYKQVQITLDSSIWAIGQNSGIYQNVATLLHEIGHAINFLAAGVGSQNSFAGDNFSDSASKANSDLIATKCIK